MKNLRWFLVVFTFVSFFLSYAQEQEKMQQVMASHDEVMAKMPDLVKLIGKLQPKVNSTKAGQEHQEAINALKASNKSMAAWMQNFGERFTADEMMKNTVLSDKKKIWLLQEEKKVKILRDKINLSIEKAEKLLEK